VKYPITQNAQITFPGSIVVPSISSSGALAIALPAANDLSVGIVAARSGIHRYSDGNGATTASRVHINNGTSNQSHTEIHNGSGANPSGEVKIMNGANNSGTITLGQWTSTSNKTTTNIRGDVNVASLGGVVNIGTVASRSTAINIGTGSSSSGTIEINTGSLSSAQTSINSGYNSTGAILIGDSSVGSTQLFTLNSGQINIGTYAPIDNSKTITIGATSGAFTTNTTMNGNTTITGPTTINNSGTSLTTIGNSTGVLTLSGSTVGLSSLSGLLGINSTGGSNTTIGTASTGTLTLRGATTDIAGSTAITLTGPTTVLGTTLINSTGGANTTVGTASTGTTTLNGATTAIAGSTAITLTGPTTVLGTTNINTTGSADTTIGNSTGVLKVDGGGIVTSKIETLAGDLTIQGNVRNVTIGAGGTVNLTGIINVNTATTGAINIGSANTTNMNSTTLNLGTASSTTTILGTTNINTSGALNTVIGNSTGTLTVNGGGIKTNTIQSTGVSNALAIGGNITDAGISIGAAQTTGQINIGLLATRTGDINIGNNIEGGIIKIANNMSATSTASVQAGTTNRGTHYYRGATVNICDDGGNVNIGQASSTITMSGTVNAAGLVGYATTGANTFTGIQTTNNQVSINGAPSNNYNGIFINCNSTYAQEGMTIRANNESNAQLSFNNNVNGFRGGVVGVNATTISYATTSDRRLKLNIKTMDTMLDKIMCLKPSEYNWVREPEKVGFGFIAQEVHKIFPQFRLEQNNCDDIENPCHCETGEPKYYGLDYGQFTPYIVKAFQELKQDYDTKLANLEARLFALENPTL
jgi:hypothetical protein